MLILLRHLDHCPLPAGNPGHPVGLSAGLRVEPLLPLFGKASDRIGVRLGEWKWVRNASGDQLFHLGDDIGESRDLSEAEPQRLRELQEVYADWLQAMEQAEPRGPFRDY